MTSLLVLLLAAGAGRQPAASIEKDRRCQQAARSAARSTPQVFADVADQADPASREQWRRFASVKELEAYARDRAVFTQAFFWRRPDAGLARIELSSESGDFVEYVDYCFSSTGRLVHFESRLNTFHGYEPSSDTFPGVSRVRVTFRPRRPGIAVHHARVGSDERPSRPEARIHGRRDGDFQDARRPAFHLAGGVIAPMTSAG